MKKVIALLTLFSVAVFAQNTFTDPRDGKKYKYVKIGSQTWMAENLNYDTKGSVCYGNMPENCKKYGRLYDWDMAMKVCPSGWHLPNNEELETLVDFAGGKEIAGNKLKAKSGWVRNGNGTDNYGFSALPGGYGYWDGSFDFVGVYGYWWSASESEDYSDLAYYRRMYYGDEIAYWDYDGKSNLLSVRCLQD